MKNAAIAIIMTAVVFFITGNSQAQGVVKMPDANPSVVLDVKPGLVKQDLWQKFVEAYGSDCNAWPQIIRLCDMYTKVGEPVDTFAGWSHEGEVFMLGLMHDPDPADAKIFKAITSNKLFPGEKLEASATGAYHVVRKTVVRGSGAQSSTPVTIGDNVGWRLEDGTHPDTGEKIKTFVGPRGPVNGESASTNPDVRRLASGKEIKTFSVFSTSRNETVVVPYILAE
ncbi:MAG: hypothetical protein WC087_00360 [Candidatus Paceibacterota bacterium]